MINAIHSIPVKWFRPPVLRLKRFSLADTGVAIESLIKAVGKTELFCNVNSAFVQAMLDAMVVRPVHAGDVILRQGRRDDTFVLLASGTAEVKCARAGDRVVRQLAVLSKPEGFGEEALLGAGIRSVSVKMLSDGFVLRIRRADFARLVSAFGVTWVGAEEVSTVSEAPVAWIWLGNPRSRPAELEKDTMAITLDRLRQRLSEFDVGRHYLCCGRDDSTSALAAFLLNQRGFDASAIRGGKRAASMLSSSGKG